MAIALEIEHERLARACEPDAPGDAVAGAVVNLPAENVVVNAPGHEADLIRVLRTASLHFKVSE
jgi:hypothetical protein